MSGAGIRSLDVDVAIIGGGPAGLAAALSAKENGAERVVVLERNGELGGILQQCIHHGFGLHRFQAELTGPEYAQRFINQVQQTDIQVLLDTMVLRLAPERQITAVNRSGMLRIDAGAVVLAMGCRERTRGALRIPGRRPAGVFSAGAAQRFVNIDGYMPGRRVVILGSGDIGLIMARRFVLEGAEVGGVVEILPYAAGLTRNVVQCLDDFDIPLLLQQTVVEIHGQERLTGVTLASVDEQWNPIPGSEQYLACDTLLLSVGLIPENELSQQAGVELDSVTNGPQVDDTLMTNLPGVFACGNVLHVHDLVDFVSQEAERAGKQAAQWVRSGSRVQGRAGYVKLTPGDNVRYVVPHYLTRTASAELFFRVRQPERDVQIALGELMRKKQACVKPSEMLHIPIEQELLAEYEGPELRVSVGRGGSQVG